MKKVSIIIPVYNPPHDALRACIESALNQSLQDIEVIVVDDGSKDDVASICDEYRNNERAIIIHTENIGVSNARNVGIETSSAPYIMFMDADDYLERDACQKCIEATKKYDFDIMSFKLVNADGTSTGAVSLQTEGISRDRQLKILKHTDWVSGYVYGSIWSKLYRKAFILENDIRFVLGVKKSQDRLFMLEVLEHNPVIADFDYAGYRYKYNSESITNKYNPNIVGILTNSFDKFRDFVDKYHSGEKDFQEALAILLLRFTYSEIELYYLNENRKTKMKEKIADMRRLFESDPLLSALDFIESDTFDRRRMDRFYDLIKKKKYGQAVFYFSLFNTLSVMKRKARLGRN